MAVLKPNDVKTSSGTYFKPKELQNALAIGFEPKQVINDVPRTYNNIQTGTGTDVICDLAVFENQVDIAAGTPDHVLKGVPVDKAGVVRVLEKNVGDVVIGRITKEPTAKGNSAYVLDLKIDDATWEKVAGYYESRDAAVADAPF